MHGSGHDIDISSGAVASANSAIINRLGTSRQSSSCRPKARTSCTLDILVTILLHVTFITYTFVIWLGESLLLPTNERDWCWSAQHDYPNIKAYDNPDYNNNPCYKERPPHLLFLSQMEISFARRMFTSVLLGAAIGFERKASDRPAGIRTMSLVCLGASFFTYVGQLAFRSSTMGSDAARVAAAIPSGVGFLGAGLIWKGTVGQKGTPDERHEIHGLTTAASVWLSAAVGVGVGGRLFVVSFYAVALVILVLRLGPRLYFQDDASSYAGDEEYYDEDDLSTYDDESSDGSSSEGSNGASLVFDDSAFRSRERGYTPSNGPAAGSTKLPQRSRSCPDIQSHNLLLKDEHCGARAVSSAVISAPRRKLKLKRRATAGVSFHS